jgi:poly-gamma-glutamate capsule biosynthesis protein CapA/YwtB (metallophosphatase superfamily)
MNASDIKILITGDFCPINRIEKLALKQDFESIFNDYINVFKGNDLNVTDLECPLTVAETVRLKYGPHQKAHPSCIGVLKYANINLAAIANNHIMDYDTAGVKETLALCRNNGIETVGIGRNDEEAGEPYTVKIKRKKIAIMNFADNEFISTPDGSFKCNPIDPVRYFNDISNVRRNNDYVIVIIHAGNEFYALPSPRTKKLYRYLIDQGSDAIISHHTHAFSGYEVYNSKPIFYGLGNFIYDWSGKIMGDWNKGYTVRLILSDKIGFEIIPLKQGNDKPGVFHLNKQEKEDFNEEINRLNSIIANDEQLETEFQKYCSSVFSIYDAFIEPNFSKIIASLRKRGLFPKLMSGRKRLLLLNLIRCESHRDVLVRMLSKYEMNNF